LPCQAQASTSGPSKCRWEDAGSPSGRFASISEQACYITRCEKPYDFSPVRPCRAPSLSNALRSGAMKTPRSSTTIAVAISLFSTICVKAYGDDHTRAHLHRSLPSSAPIIPPARPLEWGNINILHTTDTYGWRLRHQKASLPEPNCTGDFAELASLVSPMKKVAKVSCNNIYTCMLCSR